MTLGRSIKAVYSKYATFSGRATRSEFWWYQLFYLLIVGLPVSLVSETLDSLWTLANLLPSLAVTCRRLHDIERTGWWQVAPYSGAVLMAFPFFQMGPLAEFYTSPLFIIGAVITAGLVVLLIVWLATAGGAGSNRFGDDPLNRTDAEVFS